MQYSRIPDACQAQIGNFLNRSTGQLIPARCGKWSCRVCGPRAQRRFIARVLRTRSFSYFITLTSRPHAEHLTGEHVRTFNRSFRAFRQFLKRECGIGDSTWVLERGGKSGHLHRHWAVQTRKRFSYSRARAAIVRSGQGAVCNFKPVRSKRGVASYIGKYLGKHLGDNLWPRYARRCQTSIPDNRTPTGDWVFIGRPYQTTAERKREAFEFRWQPDRPKLPIENWKPCDMPGSQLTLIQFEKVHQEVNHVWTPKAAEAP